MYTLWLFNIAMENPQNKWRFEWENHPSMGHLYHGYVKSPKGIYIYKKLATLQQTIAVFLAVVCVGKTWRTSHCCFALKNAADRESSG